MNTRRQFLITAPIAALGAAVCANAVGEQSIDIASSESVVFIGISLRHFFAGREGDAMP